MHCIRHTHYHPECMDCRRKREQEEESNSSSSSLFDPINPFTAMETSIESSISIDTSTPDPPAIDTPSFGGGDFGGGGSGGDW